MEPLHPLIEQPGAGALGIIVALVIILGVQWWLGHWDKFIAVAVRWFPIWHWGG